MTYLLAFVHETGNDRKMFFEMSTARLYRQQGQVVAGVNRGEHTVVVFCDHIHGDDTMSTEELLQVALCYLEGEYTTTEVDFRQ